MCNCNSTRSGGNCCGCGSNYTLYNSNWCAMEEALRIAECAAYNANNAASQAAEFATEAAAARDQVQCLMNQYYSNNNNCGNCCCNCCN